MPNSNNSTLPIFSMLPVVNIKQQIAALYLPAMTSNFGDVLKVFSFLSSVATFDGLSGIVFLVPVGDINTIPADLDQRINPSRIILLVPETICADAEIQLRVKHFQGKGFRVLVDNFASKTELLWNGTRSISVDCQQGISFNVKHWLRSLTGDWHLAKNLNTPAMQQEAQEAGFNYFSGNYAFVPSVSMQKADGAGRARLLKLLGLVSRDADSKELEDLFKQDPGLSFQLFKLVSSAAFAQTVKVSSFGQAINLLGRRQLQRWLQLLLYARSDDNGAGLNPLMPRAAFRASMMECICKQRGGNKDEQDSAFMVGMFSLLDILFNTSLEQVLQPLNLKDDILGALLSRFGRLGEILSVVERADVYADNQDYLLNAFKVNPEDYYQCVTKSYEWVIQVCQDM